MTKNINMRFSDKMAASNAWKSLREGYRRSKNKVTTGMGLDDANESQTEHIYAEELSFLDETFEPNPIHSSTLTDTQPQAEISNESNQNWMDSMHMLQTYLISGKREVKIPLVQIRSARICLI